MRYLLQCTSIGIHLNNHHHVMVCQLIFLLTSINQYKRDIVSSLGEHHHKSIHFILAVENEQQYFHSILYESDFGSLSVSLLYDAV